MKLPVLLSFLLCLLVAVSEAKLKEGECEVCIKTLGDFTKELSSKSKNDPSKIVEEFKAFCSKKPHSSKDYDLCFYVGALPESATSVLKDLSQQLSWGKPVDKICEVLKSKIDKVCSLRFEKEIDWDNVDLKKLKVKDLKKILNTWDENCMGCAEKSDFIKRIEELKPRYVPSKKSDL